MGALSKIRDWLKMPHHFRRKDFAAREVFAADYQLVARSLVSLVDFSTHLDVGCANGFLIRELQRHGKQVQGLELSPAILEILPPELLDKVRIGDFSTATGSWDLVSCIEVAEHIPPERSVELVDTLTGRARRWIYFTAAPPGQKGKGHINCRPHAEWAAWFRERGWVVDEERTSRLRRDLEALTKAHWLRGNSLLLQRA